MAEWSRLLPGETGDGAVLRGMTFGADQRSRLQAAALASANVVILTERIDGLAIETRSFIGRIRVGPLALTIEPKIPWSRWLTLVGYALRLRDVAWTERVSFTFGQHSIADLLVRALIAEVRNLTSRGLHREYVTQRRSLQQPRGRVDFPRLVRSGGVVAEALPSRFTQRSADIPLNQALLFGVDLAFRCATDPELRSRARRLAAELAHGIGRTGRGTATIGNALRSIDRRTQRYGPAIRLVQLLRSGQSVVVHPDQSPAVPLDGFAIDMSRIWQQLLSRVLTDWSGNIDVRVETTLTDLFRPHPDFPWQHQLPRPRPDFAATLDGKLLGYLDAKYRDLWATTLPRDMLYQLSVYAFAQTTGPAVILYPTDDARAVEQRVRIQDPLSGLGRSSVALRPVRLSTLEELIGMAASDDRTRKRAEFANKLLRGGGGG